MGFFSNAWAGIVTFFTPAAKVVNGAVTTVVDTVSNFVEDVAQGGLPTFSEVADLLQGGSDGGQLTLVKNIWTGLKTDILNGFKTSTFGNAFKDVIVAIKTPLVSTAETVFTDFASPIWTKIKTFFGTISGEIKNGLLTTTFKNATKDVWAYFRTEILENGAKTIIASIFNFMGDN